MTAIHDAIDRHYTETMDAIEAGDRYVGDDGAVYFADEPTGQDLVSVRRSDLYLVFKMATGFQPDPDGLAPFALERIASAIGCCAQEPDLTPAKQSDPWDRFWAAYPRKTAKKAAKKAWDRAIKDDDPAVIVAGAERFAAHWADQPVERRTFIPYPATWLNAGSWDDELVPHASNPSKVERTRSNLVEAARRIDTGDTFETRMLGAGAAQ